MNTWFVVVPAGDPQGGSYLGPQIPNCFRIVAVPAASTPYHAWCHNEPYEGWRPIMGPFASEDQARSQAPPAAEMEELARLVGANLAPLA